LAGNSNFGGGFKISKLIISKMETNSSLKKNMLCIFSVEISVNFLRFLKVVEQTQKE